MIRPFVPGDAAGTAAMLHASFTAAYGAHADPQALEEQIRRITPAAIVATVGEHSARDAVVLVAEDGGTIVGYAAAGPSRDPDRDPAATGEVYSLYVAPSVWRAGVGRALQRECLEQVRAAGARVADLWVLSDNENATGFYDRTGWSREGAERVIAFLGGTPAVRYTRPLPVVRAFDPAADARAVAEVHVRAWQDAYRGHMTDAYLDGLDVDARERFWREMSPGGVFVALVDGRICGFVSVGESRDDDPAATSHELYAINLRATAWGSGAGLALLRTGEATLGALGAHEATLWVLEVNERGRAFYEREGWRHDGARHTTEVGGATLVELRYRKALTPK